MTDTQQERDMEMFVKEFWPEPHPRELGHFKWAANKVGFLAGLAAARREQALEGLSQTSAALGGYEVSEPTVKEQSNG